MLLCTKISRAGGWSGPVADRVVLNYDDRFRRRMAMTAAGGLSFLFEADKATLLNHGDALILNDGSQILVEAKPEPLLEVLAKSRAHQTRLAWHIGNRHLACEIDGDQLYLRDDPVIADMLVGLGATVSRVSRPFCPEAGAYAVHSHRRQHGGHSDTQKQGQG